MDPPQCCNEIKSPVLIGLIEHPLLSISVIKLEYVSVAAILMLNMSTDVLSYAGIFYNGQLQKQSLNMSHTNDFMGHVDLR